MIKRLTLVDFMAHAHTVFELAPGLNVLTGPNNTGKSAVVEALRCLAENPSPRHVIRHGATEARVEAELEDGTTVAWVRRPKYALYEITRPGATEPETYAKFGRKPPEDVQRLLRLGPVVLEGDEAVDVHLGNQREPIFLLNEPGSVAAGFFAASSEAAHLIAMQNLLTDRARKAKTEKGRLDKRLVALAAELDRLAPLPELELRLGQAASREEAVAQGERSVDGLARLLTDAARLGRARDRLLGRRSSLADLALPPVPVATAPLARDIETADTAGRGAKRARARLAVLACLAEPPRLEALAPLVRLADMIEGVRRARDSRRAWAMALAPVSPPPALVDVATLAGLVGQLGECRQALAGLSRRDRALARLAPPPRPADTAPLSGLVDALAAARADLVSARATLEAKATALEDLASRIAGRLAELGACPLCGAKLDAVGFLGDHQGEPDKAVAP